MLQQGSQKLLLHSLVSSPWSSPYSSSLFSLLISLLLFSVGAAYEGVQKRTFLAMSIVILVQIFIMLVLVLLYHKLGQLREQQINVPEPLLSSTLDSNQDGASDKEDATEMSELLTQKKTPLDRKDSGN